MEEKMGKCRNKIDCLSKEESALKKFLVPLLAVWLILPLALSSCAGEPLEDEAVVGWIDEESYFVDYAIEGDKVVFRYSFCCFNHMDEAADISISAKFKKSELKGWAEYEKFFCPTDEDGYIQYETLAPNEQRNLVFCYEGRYPRGQVNQNLSFPDEVMVVMRDTEE